MKKHVLFINHSLHSGGIEKSLVTLLRLFDYSRYEVDLQLFVDEGLFLQQVPPQVHRLPALFPPTYKQNIRQALPALLKKGHPLLALCRLLVTFAGKARGGMGLRLGKMWAVERHFVRANPRPYDAVVAFMEGQPIYYAVSCTQAPVKIGFVHGDYRAMQLDADFDRPYFQQLSALCTVSPGCQTALAQCFPELRQRCHVIYNIISPTVLHEMARGPNPFPDNFAGLRVLTIARLSLQKGLDIAMPAVAKLREEGLNFRWYIIGIGPEEAALRKQAMELGLADTVVFLGEQANPYPFLAACDLYLQPSRFEGKSIAVDEAMALDCPILLTNFSTAADQVESGVDGLIVPMDAQGIAGGLRRLLQDAGLRAQFRRALAGRARGNEQEIEKLYALMDASAPQEGRPD